MHASGLYSKSFEDLMADHLRRAPWLGLSATIHGLLAFLLMLWPQDRPVEEIRAASFQPQKLEEQIQPIPSDPEEVQKEETREDPVLREPIDLSEVDVQAPPADEPFTADLDPTDIPIESLGLGGVDKGGDEIGRNGRKKQGGARTFVPAIERGLQWLSNHQDADGRWDADEFMKHDASGEPCEGSGNSMQDVGVTGLALLAFLGDGNHPYSGTYREQVKRGVRWLVSEQDPATGLIGSRNSADFIYGHAIASYALIEAQGQSSSKLLRRPAQLAIDYLESHRNRYGVWRYQARDQDNDSSVTGWCLLAYKAAKDFGFAVNEDALQNGLSWFDRMTDPKTGRTGYDRMGGKSSRRDGLHGELFPREQGECMTAVALMCQYFLGEDPQEKPIMLRQADLIASKPPVWDEARGSIDHYYWYYGSYALFQAGKKHWRDWSRKLTDAVVNTQRKDANFKGSWDPAGAWGDDGGRVYSTAILVLTLEAYYRFPKLLVR